MSNSQSKRPRRSFATGSTHSTGPQQVSDTLRYDGEDVPVLIRLPDLSPQALMREPAADASAAELPAVDSPQGSLATSETAAPPAATTPADSNDADGTVTAGPAPSTLETSPSVSVVASPDTVSGAVQLTVDPDKIEKPVGDVAVEGVETAKQAQTGSSRTENVEPTSSAQERSTAKRRSRKRGHRQQESQQSDKVQVASRPGTRRRNNRSSTETRQDTNILAFDKTKLLIGAGLVVVAGMTYFALSGGGDDPVQSSEPWIGSEAESIVQTVEPMTEAEPDLWPSDHAEQVNHESTEQTATDSEPAAQQSVPVWPTEPNQQTANTQDAPTMPAANYAYDAPPMTPPTNSRGYSAENYVAPSNTGPTSAWPSENATTAQPASTSDPIQVWPPDAAMSAPATNNAPTGVPNAYYQSQPAGYTSPSTPAGRYGEPAARTGRLSTGPYPGGPTSTATNPGSQLNGTIEIPRPRANNEYNGSNVY